MIPPVLTGRMRAFVDHKAGIIHLSSPDGTLLGIPEGKLSPEDLSYVRSQGVYKGEKRNWASYLFRFPVHPPEQESRRGICPPVLCMLFVTT